MARLLSVVIFVASVATSPNPQPSASAKEPLVRFHHVHHRVGDPAAAMNDAAKKVEGTRVVVPGLGVGVRVGDEFVLYDRADDSNPPDLQQRPLAHAYEAAVAWLKGRGITVVPEDLSSSLIARATVAPYHHIAFAASDYDAVIARLEGEPLNRTSESAMFDAGGSLLVEVVRESDLPDAFWCPMHPDVRSGTPGQCPLCRMELVPMPPPKVGEYRMDVTLRSGAGAVTGLRVAIREPDSNALVRSFTTVHEKILHLFIVSRDLEYFAHVHPEQLQDGTFQLDHTLDPGEYMLIADFLPANATTQMIQRAIVVGARGSRGSAPGSAHLGAGTRNSGADAVSGDLRVSLTTEHLVAGKEGRLVFTVTNTTTGAPVTDLEPYLGAPAHMLIVRSDLADAVHDHPHEQVTTGPTVSFHPLIPAPGEYKLWVQFQRGGRVSTFSFVFRAEQ